MTHSEFSSFDGTILSYRTQGQGRPVVMLHGFLANSQFNWTDPGIADALAGADFEAIMLDHRGHGRSAAPECADAYPPDALAHDAMALIAHLGLAHYDLVGYSLGGRTAVRMLVLGAEPRRCVIGGMGDSGVIGSAARVAFFEDAIGKGEAGAYPQAARLIGLLMERAQVDPDVMLKVLRSQVQTPEESLRGIETPILVVSGDRDHDNGSAEGLAELLPNARAMRVKGDHFTAVNAELGQAIVDFLR